MPNTTGMNGWAPWTFAWDPALRPGQAFLLAGQDLAHDAQRVLKRGKQRLRFHGVTALLAEPGHDARLMLHARAAFSDMATGHFQQ